MKKILFMLAAITCFSTISCTEEEKKEEMGGSGSIVGEWSGVSSIEEKGDNSAIRVHFIIKSDGTYEQILPAWEEKRKGTYSIKDDVISFSVTELDWLWDRMNGYDGVYDQYDSYWNPEKYAENAKPYANPHAVWQEKHPGEANCSCKIKMDSNNNLSFEVVSGDFFSPRLIYFSNPGFKAEKPAK